MAYLGNPNYSKGACTVLQQHVINNGKFHRLEILSTCHSTTKPGPPTENHKCDLIGPSDPHSNLRPIHFFVPENEVAVEKKFRLKRQEVQKWNQDFWTAHNSKFVKPKSGKGSQSSDKIKKCSMTSSMSAPDNLSTDKKKLSEEAFQNWLQSKKEDRLMKQEQETKMKQMVKEQKQMKKETAELSFALWKHKKNQQIRANELKVHRVKEEQAQQQRLKQQASRERVCQWMSSSKDKPRPVRSNMGLLSLTGNNPPSFFNPHPWAAPV